jgi:serine protease Do
MFSMLNLRLFVLIILGFLCTHSVAQESIEQLEEAAIQRAVRQIGSSLVRFETIGGLDRVDGKVVSQSPSTGVAISQDGWIVSASFHFAHQPASILATLPDGTKAAAEIVGRDLSRKLVLLKIKTDYEFAVPEFVDRGKVAVGQTVIGVGRVLSVDQPNVTTGIVSALHRVWGRAVQTDAKISPANFGGPMLDLTGRVIGILVPLSPDDDSEMAGTEWYDSGIGFAVPLDGFLERMDLLKAGSSLRSGLIGISIKGSDPYAEGVEVAFCPGTSPAAVAGVRAGDKVVEANGTKIVRHSDLKHVLGPLYEEEIVQLKVNREGKELEFEIKLTGEIEPFVPVGLGVIVRRSVEADALLVQHVVEGSAAAEAGFQVGDEIKRIGESDCNSADEIRLAISTTGIGEQILADVVRGGKMISIEANTEALASSVLDLSPFEKDRDVEVLEIKVPDFVNRCIALVPKPNSEVPGLVVWMPAPGKNKKEELEKVWREACQKQNMIVMVPESKDEKRWNPDEVAFVVAALERLKKRRKFDSSRVAVGGAKTGGSMAGLVGFAKRDIFRGLVLVESALTSRAFGVTTSPVQPMAIMLGRAKPAKDGDAIGASEKRLMEANFPVHVEVNEINVSRGIGSAWAEAVLKWARGMDRI